jgi:hypothetical protein
VAYEGDQWPDDIHIMIGAMRFPERVEPGFHIFWDERLPWLCINDALTRYRKKPSDGETIEM